MDVSNFREVIGQKKGQLKCEFVEQCELYDGNVTRALNKSAIVSITDITGRIVHVNENFCNITKYDRNEIIGQKHADIIVSFHSDSFWIDMIQDVKQGGSWNRDVKIGVKGGSSYWLNTLISPMYDKNGHLIRIISVQFDITKHKTIEEEKLLLLSRYDKITSNIPGFIYQYHLGLDGSQSFPFLSGRVEELFDVPSEVLMKDAEPAFDKIHADDIDLVRDSVNQSAENLSHWNQVFRICHANNRTVWVQGLSVPERMKDGSTMWHGFFYDITLSKLSEERALSQKIRLNEIAFIQAHEFRRPVANMIGIYNLLKESIYSLKEDKKDLVHWLDLMHQSISETDDIIKKILTKTSEE